MPRYPDGWYCVSLSHDIKAGEVRSIRAFGQDLVLFRTQSGKAVVLDAYCPHLGAHMGYGGTVVDETLRCPFHGYYYDTNGQCSKTDYGSGIPKQACSKSWLVDEKNGVIMLYYGESAAAPNWQIPAYDYDNYVPLRSHQFSLNTHVQDVNENSVDLGHFRHVHTYERIEVLHKPRIDGQAMIVEYAMIRDNGLLGFRQPFRQELHIEVHGLGFSHVDVNVPALGLQVRVLVMTTPVDESTTLLRIANSVCRDIEPVGPGKILAALPTTLLMPLLNRVLQKAYIHDVSQDLAIWQNKVYVQNPAVMKGDGPIHFYRKYCQRFYPQLAPSENQQLYQNARPVQMIGTHSTTDARASFAV